MLMHEYVMRIEESLNANNLLARLQWIVHSHALTKNHNHLSLIVLSR